jgi:hypothetical protein
MLADLEAANLEVAERGDADRVYALEEIIAKSPDGGADVVDAGRALTPYGTEIDSEPSPTAAEDATCSPACPTASDPTTAARGVDGC